MEEWKEYKLGDISEIQTGPFGSQLHQSDYVEKGTPCIMPTNIGSQLDIKTNGIAHVKDEDVARLHRHCVKVGDIIYSRRGDIEKCAYINQHEEGWLCGTGCLRIRVNAEKATPHFVAYQLATKTCKRWVVNNAVGTTMPNLNTGILKELPLLLPPMDVQMQSVSVLSALDDKIAVNRRICENLEAQAQALFKHWFIDFAPFKNGKFVESELGMIPDGWRVGTLTEIADYLNGLAMQKFPPISDEDAIPVLKIKELGQSQCDNNSDKCSKQIKPEYIIKNGDVVFSWSGTLMVDIWCGGISGLNQHLFKVTSDNYPKWFYLMWTKHHLAEFIRIAKDKAVTMGHIKRSDLEKALVAIPDSYTRDKMSGVMNDIFDQIINTRLESNTLSTLRDTLLPKLMSGQIKV